MESHNLVAIVTIVAVLLFLVMGLRVGQARGRFDVPAPAMSGHPEFDRHFRVHMNTLEGLVMFLPALWLFARYWNDLVAAGIGCVWLIGRIIYMLAYVRDPSTRSTGFLTQAVAMLALLLGALGGAVWSIIHTGAL
jgi:glutathione S-transferase